MRGAAYRYGNGFEDEELWGIAGMLHDADYDQWPEDHPNRIVVWLRERDEEELAYAISAHYTKWGVPHNSQLDKALLACDELTGLITAVTLVRPSKSISDLKVRSVRKKWKDKAFASGVDRLDIERAALDLDVELWTHVSNVIEAMRSVAFELGL